MIKRLLLLLCLAGMLAGIPHLIAQERTGRLPLGQGSTGDAYMPRPFGIGFNYWHQNQDYSIQSLEVHLPEIPLPSVDQIGVNNKLNEYNVKFDTWIFPFLNIFGILGSVEGETNVILQPYLENVRVEYDGLVYGGGFTVAAGTDHLFGSFTTTFTDTNLDEIDSSIKTWIFTPKAGVHFAPDGVLKHVAVWGGAMSQYLDERHSGTMEIPGIGSPVTFDVNLKQKNTWNGLAGASFDFGSRWLIETEAGFGNRNSFLMALTYRFTR